MAQGYPVFMRFFGMFHSHRVVCWGSYLTPTYALTDVIVEPTPKRFTTSISERSVRLQENEFACAPRTLRLPPPFLMHAGLADQFVILGMGANPEPDKSIIRFNSDRPIVKTRARRPESANFLKVERGMF
jgi:hypothetical protein